MNPQLAIFFIHKSFLYLSQTKCVRPLKQSENPQDSSIVKNTSNYDVWNKQLPKSTKMPLIPFFLINPVHTTNVLIQNKHNIYPDA